MKLLLSLTAALFVASPCLAGVMDIAPSTDKLDPAEVERAIVIRKETFNRAGIRLVKVDNGGSSDISGLMAPSRLYLTFHQDGEMFDILGSYLVSDGVLNVTYAKLTGGELRLDYTYRDDHLKVRKARYRLLLADAIQEAATAQQGEGEEGDYVLKSTIGAKSLQP
jgi:hypothetical protein